MEDLTIIYYSSNQENEGFERRTREHLKQIANNLQIISVTQKPVDLGKNIVVGDVGASGFNMFRQVQIALREVKTKFVLSAEVDCLYPPDYFTYSPPREDKCYRNSNLYVMAHKRSFFWEKPEGATHAQIIGRDFYLDRLDKLFKNAPEWSIEEKNFPRERGLGIDIFKEDDIRFYRTKYPVIQIKTSDSMRHHTRSERVDTYELPYWGSGKKLKPKYVN